MRAALAAGVTAFTHLFNAMSPLASRATEAFIGTADNPILREFDRHKGAP
jgi:N-acetylglucosamine-6-phosphate deacetylase